MESGQSVLIGQVQDSTARIIPPNQLVQWSPTIAVRPDGWLLFVRFYDRRLDPQNVDPHTFGNVYTVNLRGDGSLTDNDPNFKISDQGFPALNVNPQSVLISDYDTARADKDYIYYTWGDQRNVFIYFSQGEPDPAKEYNIRFTKMQW